MSVVASRPEAASGRGARHKVDGIKGKGRRGANSSNSTQINSSMLETCFKNTQELVSGFWFSGITFLKPDLQSYSNICEICFKGRSVLENELIQLNCAKKSGQASSQNYASRLLVATKTV